MVEVVKNLPVEKRLELVFAKAVKLLPGELGRQLQSFVSPSSLATMAAVLIAWAGSHFFGAGEIADVVLLIVGWAAVGGVAIEAGEHIISFIRGTLDAKTDQDCDEAAKHLAKAVVLLGVQLVLTLLLRKKPNNTFKTTIGRGLPKYSQAFPAPLPRNAPLRYRPKLIFTKKMNYGNGSTNLAGDIKVGHGARFGNPNAAEVRATLYHEKVHQFLTPKLYLFRNIRVYLKQSSYRQSFILRYLEEALAETIGLLRAYGMSGKNLLRGLKFPLQSSGYQITYAALGMEARGILLGPVVAGGMVYNVYYGIIDHH